MLTQQPVRRRDGDAPPKTEGRVRLEIYGEEMVEKIVKMSGNSGRIYLPLEWVGSRVKIIRQD